MSRRRRLAGIAVVVLALVGAGTTALLREHGAPACGGDERMVAAASVPPVFVPPAQAADPRLARLVKAAGAWGIGPVIGAVGYDYGQWLSAGALGDGLVTWTRANAVLGVLDADLKPRFGIQQAKVQHAWDADARSFYELELAAHRPLQLSAYALGDGQRRWCAQIGTVPTRYGDPFGTATLAGGDLLAMADGGSGRAVLQRLDGATGRARWSTTLSGIDRGGFLAEIGGGLAVVGGRASYDLGNAQHPRRPGPALAGVEESDGRVRWRYTPDGEAHVLGPSAGGVVIEVLGATGMSLEDLDDHGRRVWRARPRGLGTDATVVGGVVLVNTGSALLGLDPATGHERWHTAYPRSTQYFPYGFQLAAQPMWDQRRLLLAGTTGLHLLDLRTGAIRTLPLPIDGINTTYWPYQVVLTPRLVVVVTNTGAVALRRESAAQA